MTLSRTRLALALAALFCASAPALASDCVYGTASGNKSQCYPTYAPIDPATGLSPAAGNSGGTSSVVKQGAKDSTAAPWDVNNAQIAGAPLSVGAGTTDAGTQRTQANQGAANAGGAAAWPVLLDPAAANAVSQGPGSSTPANGWHTFADGTNSSGGIALVARLPSSAATNNATVVKGTAARLYKIKGTNTTAAPIRIKIYNKSTAPAPATDVPLDVCVLPANATASCDMMDIGWFLSAGFGYATVTGAADNDNTAVTAGAVTDLSFGYK